MASLLNMAWESGSLVLNVEGVYRVDASSTDAAKLFYNVASGASVAVWATTVKFSADITSGDLDSLRVAIDDVQQIPNGIVTANRNSILDVGSHIGVPIGNCSVLGTFKLDIAIPTDIEQTLGQ